MSMSTGISRRSLLKGAALSAAGVAALGVMGCSPQASGASDDAAASERGGDRGRQAYWSRPDPSRRRDQETVDASDINLISGGYSGTCCALSAAENGAKVILVEGVSLPGTSHGVGL